MGPSERERTVIVLARARNPSNIGAVARAMHDLGFSTLRIVNEYPVPFASAKSAVDASVVLEAATEHTHLADAVADCTLVLGTTAVGERNLAHPLHTLHAAGPIVHQALARSPHARVALLFGSEKTGLSNVELSYCHALLTIPMSTPPADAGQAKHLSMNLGQAAAVCLYSLSQPTQIPASSEEPAAKSSDLERIAFLLREVMDQAGYTRRNPANAREIVIRRMVHRMNLCQSDAALWTGIFRQTLHALHVQGRQANAPGSASSSNLEESLRDSER